MITPVPEAITAAYDGLRNRSAARDRRMKTIHTVRDGRMHELFPDRHVDDFEGTIVANKIDTAARDMAEVVAPLPALNCASGAMTTDADKRRANVKNRIGQNYWRQSRLATQMLSAADQYLTYGFLVAFQEIDWKRQTPVIQLDDPMGGYYDVDRYGTVLRYAKVWSEQASVLAARFPEQASKIGYDDRGVKYPAARKIDVIRYADKTHVTLFADGCLLAQYEHGLGRCPAEVAERPGLRKGRGQYDDVIYAQLAKAMMAQYALTAADKAVNAPIAVPRDIQELNVGPDALIVTDNPQSVARVSLQVPQSAFAMMADLDGELSEGMRYPDLRAGQSSASVITGRGVQSMMGTFDTQIKTAQTILGDTLGRATEMCFELDEIHFPNVTKSISGTMAGESFKVTYTPVKDINGEYTADVAYGFAAGQTPQGAIVTLLQLQSGGIIDKDTFRENLPFDIDQDNVQRRLDVQNYRDALSGGVQGLATAIPAMIQMGLDPSTALRQIAELTKARQDGKAIESVIADIFAPPKQPEPDPNAPVDPAADPAMQGGGGVGNGLPEGTAPGQAGLPPGGLPTVMNMVSGFRGDAAQMDTSTRRRVATGGR